MNSPFPFRYALLALPACLLLTATTQAQGLYNNGAVVAIAPGTTVSVLGGAINAAGTITQDGNLLVTGNLSNAGILNLSTGVTSLQTGDFVNTGTLTPGTGTVTFVGTLADQTLNAPGATIYRLRVNNTAPIGQNRVLVPADIVISNLLTLTTGMVRTAPSATITLLTAATLSGEATGRYVQGNLKVARTGVSGLVDFGHGLVLDATGQNLGTVRITRTAGLQTAGVSYGTNMAASTKGIDRVWAVSASSQPTSAIPLTLNWLPDDDNGLVSFAQSSIWQAPSAAGLWGRLAAPANAAARSLTQTTSSLSTFTVSNADNPLPVELISFTAEAQSDNAVLNWRTASEKNNHHFEVEASANGTTFHRIGTVAGHGSTMQTHDYQLTDKNISRYATDLVYYRLRQVDRDGTATFSPVRTVRVSAPASLTAQAWPNPFGNAGQTLTVRTATTGPVSMELRDALGRALFNRQFDLPAGTSTLPLAELGKLPAGVYVLRLTQASQHVHLKVVRE